MNFEFKIFESIFACTEHYVRQQMISLGTQKRVVCVCMCSAGWLTGYSEHQNTYSYFSWSSPYLSILVYVENEENFDLHIGLAGILFCRRDLFRSSALLSWGILNYPLV